MSQLKEVRVQGDIPAETLFQEGDLVKRYTISLFFLLLFGAATYSHGSDNKFNIKGDFRYRHEWLQLEDAKARVRQRVRARVNIEGKVNDQTKVVFGISSGSPDPVSNNQSLGDGWSSKAVVLDLAYVEYRSQRFPGLTLTGGKMHNPFFLPGESELIWDSDIRQEGIAAHYSHDFDSVSILLTGGGFWLEERSKGKNSSLMSGQGVLEYHIPDGKSGVAVGGSYFGYENVKGYTPFFDAEDAFGNTTVPVLDTAGNTTGMAYRWNYRLMELFAEAETELGDVPVTVMGDYVNNTAADSLNDGWLVGVRVGKIKTMSSLGFRFIYREIKKDAVIGMFTDSDFRGGGTDGKGSEMGADVQLTKSTTLSLTYFNNKVPIENGKTFQRVQVDAKFKF
jgi:hypothetical protein